LKFQKRQKQIPRRDFFHSGFEQTNPETSVYLGLASSGGLFMSALKAPQGHPPPHKYGAPTIVAVIEVRVAHGKRSATLKSKFGPEHSGGDGRRLVAKDK
jgi:hypothetical protein